MCRVVRSSALISRFLFAFHQGKDGSRFGITPTLSEKGFVCLNGGHDLSEFGCGNSELLGVAMGWFTKFFCGKLQFALRAAFEACVMLRNTLHPSIFEEDVGMAHIVGIEPDRQLCPF